MGGTQSGTNNLGDALWMHERQRQRSQRESARYESSQNSGQITNDRRKLLKRTRSLAVITEDTSRSDRSTRENFHFGEQTNFSIPRRPQLIPRAKLIDRNSLKDRLSKSQQHLYDPQDRIEEERFHHSRSTCDLYSIPPPLSYFHEITPLCSRVENRIDPDRLNILDWPQTPRRYRSHQDLDTVSGLVDIVEDNWPVEERRNCDVYSQVKRKRKGHRSLDSILFEDERELEYFDVLNLLPLSKVRLELDESDTRSHHNLIAAKQIKELSSPNLNFGVVASRNFDIESIEESERRQTPRILQVSEFSDDNQDDSLHLSSNVTDEEKCKSHSVSDEVDKTCERSHAKVESWHNLITLSCSGDWETDSRQESFRTFSGKEEEREIEETTEDKEVKKQKNKKTQEKPDNLVENALEGPLVFDIGDGSIQRNSNVDVVIVDVKHETLNTIGETGDFKSIWVSDTDDEMSRRPQVLKIVDNDVTRKQRRNVNVGEIDTVSRDMEKSMEPEDIQAVEELCMVPSITPLSSPSQVKEKNEELCQKHEHKRSSIKDARNFFEAKRPETEISKNQQNEGRFERIVKETTNIIGKACNAVKGSLGFEARSESSDLGLGSDCGSDTRRRSIDDDADITDDMMCHESPKQFNEQSNENYFKAGKINLTRSQSCVDSLECQPDTDGLEFNHIRYKIIKSKLFGKNIFTNVPSKGEADYDGLMQYLQEYSIQELLLDNNVVIIEPVRAEPVEIKASSTYNRGKITSTCRVAGSVEKKIAINKNDQNDRTMEIDNSMTVQKQSTLRKHFFYHPIRVNRELIDEELPDPDTVRNVRRMFETTLRPICLSHANKCETQKSVSMKNLSCLTESQLDNVNERGCTTSRSRCYSRAKDLTRLYEGLEKKSSTKMQTEKKNIVCSSRDSKTRILAQSFEARSGNTSPSDSGCARNKITRYRHQNHRQREKHTNWDNGSVSSGVSSDYPDTDGGSGVQCTSSEDEDVDCRGEDEMRNSERVHGHFVSQDVLRKIRECGTSVTYYGGKVVNTCNGPLVSPFNCSINRNELNSGDDYVKFRLVKSNSCDSRLELTGRVIERRSRLEARDLAAKTESTRKSDLRTCTIAETPSIEITSLDNLRSEENDFPQEYSDEMSAKHEPPIVIGLEPKKEENRQPTSFKADFKLGKFDDGKSNMTNRFGSALMRWQINETNWNKKQTDFGKMEFEEFEVLEDSLNGPDNR